MVLLVQKQVLWDQVHWGLTVSAAGSAEQAKVSMKKGVGSVLGDAKLQAEGKLEMAEGKAPNTIGGIREILKGR
ncbi:MAG: CsbD family protein [Polyangiaceae bacterium]|jgi:uncharacterized protein YjbJ (UPF0337 family)|nr:CsbD family protein [Microvirga sp.]MDF3072146.1 CsbD family protein [Polyangiaceae bacterium]